MGKIRVLHVGLDTHLGGIETYLMKITSHIDSNTFQFDFLAYDNEKPYFYDELTALGCNFYFVTSRRKSFLKNKKDLEKLFKEEHFDIVHCHLNSLTYIAPVLGALKANVKVIVHSRNAGSSIGSSSKILCALNRIRFPYDKITMVAVSDKAGSWMFGENHKFTVLNNGIDTNRFEFSQAKREAIRKEFGLSEGQEVIAHVGAFRPQKNHVFLIKVLNEYLKRFPNAILLLVGTGELENSIKNQVEELKLEKNVIFTGNRKDLDCILSASDKFLFPSLYEGFPNALLEAQASGLLCVASTAITEQACLENCIRVSLEDSTSEWVKALSNQVKQNRQVYAHIVEENGFGIETEMKRLENLYNKVLCEK